MTLVERLRAHQEAGTWYDGGYRPWVLINPDGPEAADALAAQAARIEELTRDLDEQRERKEYARRECEKAEHQVAALEKALAGVVRVADRKTAEFDAARAALGDGQ